MISREWKLTGGAKVEQYMHLIKLSPELVKEVYSIVGTPWTFHANPLAKLLLLERAMADCPNPVDNQHHQAIVQRVLAAYKEAKLVQWDVPLAYKPGGEWDDDIKTRRANYLKVLHDNDISGLTDLLKNFFRNSGVAGLWIYDYYSDIARASTFKKKRFVNSILQDFLTWKDLVDNADIHSISAPPIGNPWGYIIEGNLIMPTSFPHHYYASHVLNLLADIKNPVVAEIGGGFGGFAYYLLSSGKPVKYINFDLPEVLLIESYYLLNAFKGRKFLLFDEAKDINISLDVINSYDIILMPNFQLPTLASNSVDLFINTASLSEMDYHTIEEYISQIVRTCKLYFFHENSDRETLKGAGHVEMRSSRFPIPADAFEKICESKSLWGGGWGRYREYLYQRL